MKRYRIVALDNGGDAHESTYDHTEIEEAIDTFENHVLIEAILGYKLFIRDYFTNKWDRSTVDKVYADLEEEEYILKQEQGD